MQQEEVNAAGGGGAVGGARCRSLVSRIFCALRKPQFFIFNQTKVMLALFSLRPKMWHRVVTWRSVHTESELMFECDGSYGTDHRPLVHPIVTLVNHELTLRIKCYILPSTST